MEVENMEGPANWDAALTDCYGNRNVGGRIREYLGEQADSGWSCVYISANGPHDEESSPPLDPSRLDILIEERKEVYRSLWDRRYLLAHLALEYAIVQERCLSSQCAGKFADSWCIFVLESSKNEANSAGAGGRTRSNFPSITNDLWKKLGRFSILKITVLPILSPTPSLLLPEMLLTLLLTVNSTLKHVQRDRASRVKRAGRHEDYLTQL